MSSLNRPWVPFVLPFAVFMGLLAVAPSLGLPPTVEGLIRVALPAVVLWAVSRPVIDLRPTRPWATVAIGAAVFVLWVGPDYLFPGYRESVLFQNALVGRAESSMPVEARTDVVVLILRFLRAAAVVPVLEELFWRGWLPRWIDRSDDFLARPLGAYTAFSFGVTALLFGLEHGAFWDVGIAAGLIYNWWMLRTRSLGDVIWCHAVTNALLGGYVVAMGEWKFW